MNIYDELVLVVRETDGPYGSGNILIEAHSDLSLLMPEVAVSVDLINQIVDEQLTKPPTSDWIHKTSSSDVNWGASSTSLLVEIAVNAALGATAPAVAAAISKYLRSLGTNPFPTLEEFSGESDLVEWARWAIETQYGRGSSLDLGRPAINREADITKIEFTNSKYRYWVYHTVPREVAPLAYRAPLKLDSDGQGNSD